MVPRLRTGLSSKAHRQPSLELNPSYRGFFRPPAQQRSAVKVVGAGTLQLKQEVDTASRIVPAHSPKPIRGRSGVWV